MEGDAGNTERARELFHCALSVKANPQTLSAMATLERRYMPLCCYLICSLECLTEHLLQRTRTLSILHAAAMSLTSVHEVQMLHGAASQPADPQVWQLRGGTHAAGPGAGAQPSASTRPARAGTGGRSLQVTGRFSKTAVRLADRTEWGEFCSSQRSIWYGHSGGGHIFVCCSDEQQVAERLLGFVLTSNAV